MLAASGMDLIETQIRRLDKPSATRASASEILNLGRAISIHMFPVYVVPRGKWFRVGESLWVSGDILF
jgi:hypothetical protein